MPPVSEPSVPTKKEYCFHDYSFSLHRTENPEMTHPFLSDELLTFTFFLATCHL